MRRFDADYHAVQVGEHDCHYHINHLKLYKSQPEAHRDPALALLDGPALSSSTPALGSNATALSPIPLILNYGSVLMPLVGLEEPE